MICAKIAALADQARLEGKPLPVIEAPFEVAIGIAEKICREVGRELDLRCSGTYPVVAMYDGVAVVVRS